VAGSVVVAMVGRLFPPRFAPIRPHCKLATLKAAKVANIRHIQPGLFGDVNTAAQRVGPGNYQMSTAWGDPVFAPVKINGYEIDTTLKKEGKSASNGRKEVHNPKVNALTGGPPFLLVVLKFNRFDIKPGRIQNAFHVIFCAAISIKVAYAVAGIANRICSAAVKFDRVPVEVEKRCHLVLFFRLRFIALTLQRYNTLFWFPNILSIIFYLFFMAQKTRLASIDKPGKIKRDEFCGGVLARVNFVLHPD